MEKLYVIRNLRSGYAHDVLKDISLDIGSGSLVSLIGPNGSGKTTLLRVLSGLKSYTGSVTLNGQEVSRISRKAFARMLGFVMSGRNFHPSYPFTAREIIAMGRMPFMTLLSRLTPSDERIITNAATLSGTLHLLDRNVMTLSDGERQLVLIACALAQDTETLLLDEPANSLDPDKAARVYSLLRSLADSGRSIIASVHDVNIACAYSDSFIALKDGRVISHGGIRELNGDILRELYGVKFISYSNPEGNVSMWRALPD